MALPGRSARSPNTLVGGLPFGPVVDGDLIPLATVDAVLAGIGADKALMLGSTDHEFNFAMNDLTDELAGEDAAEMLGRLGVAAPAAAPTPRRTTSSAPPRCSASSPPTGPSAA